MQKEHLILHQTYVRYGANTKEWMRKCVLLLPEIEKYHIWEQMKFGSIHEYVAKLSGMSRSAVDDALRILRKIEDKPALQKIVAIKGINAVRPVAAIATIETAEFWAEKARVMSKHTLEVYVKELSRTGTENNAEKPHEQAISFLGANDLADLQAGSLPHRQGGAFGRKIVAMELDPEVVGQLEKLKGDGDWNELMKQFLKMREEKLEEQKPESVECENRYIPAKIRNFVIARTNGRCAFPGCSKPFKILHHTQRFALENIHDASRLHAMCKAHERIAHLGLIENEELAPQFWKLRKEADRNAPKYEIDIIVNKFRMAGRGTG